MNLINYDTIPEDSLSTSDNNFAQADRINVMVSGEKPNENSKIPHVYRRIMHFSSKCLPINNAMAFVEEFCGENWYHFFDNKVR